MIVLFDLSLCHSCNFLLLLSRFELSCTKAPFCWVSVTFLCRVGDLF